jgi:hypothetical protein
MKKIKFGYCKTAMAALLIISGSFAHAAPSTQEMPIASLLEWLISTGQKPETVVCNDFPMCPPDFAPEQDPTKPDAKEKKKT